MALNEATNANGANAAHNVIELVGGPVAFIVIPCRKVKKHLQDGAPKIAKLPYQRFNHSLWYP